MKTGQFSPEWSNALKAAYDLRQLSDYDADFTGTLAEAEKILEQAKTFVAEVEKVLQQQFQIQNGNKQYIILV